MRGVEPERGRSAIQAAAEAIAAMDLGRLDKETSANIGVIRGGVATNIVPDVCTSSRENAGATTRRGWRDVAAAMVRRRPAAPRLRPASMSMST